MDSEIGNLRCGAQVEKYSVIGVLGQGGMACVYKVRHRTLGTVHALKVLTHASSSVRRRLMLEGRVQASLHHNNIVGVTDVLDLPEGIGLVLEYVAGAALDELLAKRMLSFGQIDQLAEGIFRGVSYAHDQGLVHRDLKPANVLLQVEGRRVVAKVADFGLVKATGQISATRTGVAMGTPRYMSPEQIRDAKSVDARGDVFAIGAILYEMITGKAAFSPDDEDLLRIFNAIAEYNYLPVHDLRPEAPMRMVRAVQRALDPDLSTRVQSVAELRGIWFGTEHQKDVAWELKDLGTSSDSVESQETEAPGGQPTLAAPPVAELRQATETSSEPSMPGVSGWGTQRSTTPARIVVLGLAAFLATVVLTVGIHFTWSALQSPSTSAVEAPRPEPSMAAPVDPAVEPLVQPMVGPEPNPIEVEPEVIKKPTPMPVRPGRPRMVPKPSAPAPSVVQPSAPVVVPTPPPAPVVAPTRFQITGARGYLRSNGIDHRPGPIPPGTYTVLAFFGDLPITVTSKLVVKRGQKVQVVCKPLFKLCDVSVSP